MGELEWLCVPWPMQNAQMVSFVLSLSLSWIVECLVGNSSLMSSLWYHLER